jgi:ABC-type antimicrobial peptide transport system permease subunit
MRQGLGLTGAGIGIGIAGALVLTRLLASQLYGVRGRDPATFTAVALLLSIVAAMACYLPARRTMRVDPLIAMRAE